jgi:hypothetical protein
MTTALAECTKNQQCEILLLCSEGVKNNYIYERVTVKYDDILHGTNVACKWWKAQKMVQELCWRGRSGRTQAVTHVAPDQPTELHMQDKKESSKRQNCIWNEHWLWINAEQEWLRERVKSFHPDGISIVVDRRPKLIKDFEFDLNI